jgi:hypothetical protein
LESHAWRVVSVDLDGDTFSIDLTLRERTVSIVADVTFQDRVACLWGAHILADGPNRFGYRSLLSLIPWALDFLDVDELRIAGATRTSGAAPGHLPPELAFRRDGTRRLAGNRLG